MIKRRKKIRILEVDGALIINSQKKNIIKFCQKEAYFKFIKEIHLDKHLDLFNAKYNYYHKYYYPKIQYSKFEDMYPRHKFKYIFVNKGRLYRYFILSQNDRLKSILYNLIDTFLTQIHNKLIWKPCDFLIFEYVEDDKRNQEVIQYIKRKYDTNFVNGTTIKSKIKNFFNSRQIYILRHRHGLSSNYEKYAEQQNEVYKKQLSYYSKILKNKAYTLIGVDDPCIINPFLAAINQNGTSIGVQHGYYSKFNVGYDDNLSRNWFKNLIVWSNVDLQLANKFLGTQSETKIHVGANFFLPSGFLEYNANSRNVFIVGEENTDHVIQNKLVASLLEANFQILTILKDRSKGTDGRLIYLGSLEELRRYAVKLLIGRKSSLILKFMNQGIPIALLQDEEGYLSDIAEQYGLHIVDDPVSIFEMGEIPEKGLIDAVGQFETILEQIIKHEE